MFSFIIYKQQNQDDSFIYLIWDKNKQQQQQQRQKIKITKMNKHDIINIYLKRSWSFFIS